MRRLNIVGRGELLTTTLRRFQKSDSASVFCERITRMVLCQSSLGRPRGLGGAVAVGETKALAMMGIFEYIEAFCNHMR